jgi:dihydroxyacid dehydratase/phosphogluconate dehydratase
MNAAIPAVDSHRYTLAHIGRRAVEMAHEDLRMSKILTCKALKTLFAWLATADPPTR